MVRVGIEMRARECLLGSCIKARRALFSAVRVIQVQECVLGALTKGRTHPRPEAGSKLWAQDCRSLA